MASFVRNLKAWVENDVLHSSWDAVWDAEGYSFTLVSQFGGGNNIDLFHYFTEYTTDTRFTVSGTRDDYLSNFYGVKVTPLPDGEATFFFLHGEYMYPKRPEPVGDIRNLNVGMNDFDLHAWWDTVPNATGYVAVYIRVYNLENITNYESITPDQYYRRVGDTIVQEPSFFMRGYYPKTDFDGVMVYALPDGRPSFYIFDLGYFYPFETTGNVTGLRADVYYDPFANVRLSWNHVENAEGYKYIIRKPMYEFYAASTTIQSSGTIVTGETSENMVTIEDFGLRFGVGYFECEVYALPDGESSYESFYVDQVVGKPQKWEWYTPKISEETFNLTAVEWNDFCARINHYGYYYDFPWRSPFEYGRTTSATAASSGYNGYYQPYPFTIVKKSDRVMASYINEAIEALGIIYDRGSYHGGVIYVASVSAFALTTDIGTMDRQITGSPPPLPDFVNEGDIIYAELFIQLRDCLNAIGVYVDAPR